MTSRPRAFPYRAMQNASPTLLLTVGRDLIFQIPEIPIHQVRVDVTTAKAPRCARNFKQEEAMVMSPA